MNITPLKQPPRSRLCGQTCVAMLAGISLAESVKIFGHRHGTKVTDLHQALKTLHIHSDSVLRIVQDGQAMPQTFIAQVKSANRKRGWHWVLVHDGCLYDPAFVPLDGRINAFLEVRL